MAPSQVKKIEALRSSFRGEVLLPGEEAYERARKIWNATIDKHPAMILRCSTTSDVVHAVNFAGTAGTCSPSVVADTTSPATPCATTVS